MLFPLFSYKEHNKCRILKTFYTHSARCVAPKSASILRKIGKKNRPTDVLQKNENKNLAKWLCTYMSHEDNGH